MHSRLFRIVLGLLVTTAWAACGTSQETKPAPPAPELAWAGLEFEAANSTGEAGLDAALARWPLEDSRYASHPLTQRVLTWRMRRALERGATQQAHEDFDRLQAAFAGKGRSRSGRELPKSAVLESLRLGLLRAARSHMQAPQLDRHAAQAELARAAALDAGGARASSLLQPRLERWIAATHAADLLGTPLEPAPERAALVIVTDVVTVGRSPLEGQINRWCTAGRQRGMHVHVGWVNRGYVGTGLRLHGASPDGERRAQRKFLEHAGARGLSDAATRHLRAICPPDTHEVMMFLVNAKDKIVSRWWGRAPDLQVLEAARQRLLR